MSDAASSDTPLNRPLAELPARCDVLVVGAGPAGAAAATRLAAAGFEAVLIDQQAFPRDKVCGDGLIPDAHRALEALGVHAEVMAAAQPVAHVRCIGPRGGHVDVPGRLAVLPRRELDLIVCRNAARAGARMHAPARFVAPIEDAGRVIGARLAHGGVERAIEARWTVLASGAPPQASLAAGVCGRRTPSAIALRGYVRNAAMVGRITELEVLWHKKLRPGYGWIFPCRDGVFNLGVGVAQSHQPGRDGRHAMQDVNLRAVFDAFIDAHPPARELVRGGRWLAEPKGAPLRCSLEGAAWSRPGLLVAGEAAGSTYALTGEGIGKALETGLLAADALADGLRAQHGDAAIAAAYAAKLHALRPRFRIYEKANTVNARPWLVDLLVWSARRSPSRLARMSGVLEETYEPSNLVSARSFARLLFER
ncbi:MAG TPA: geranylgeranyl reductase family protein [Methylibium sp.]|uniref:NAD(P)/FAD-dependent oxidoreductase n=1 Tax=Methylibium sp. TaxID=2067992 RepID=UPI002DB5FAF2|nr:geranylgeranyl reductase family protein [Methylibium sp.]HEU4460381.1 geranylgeranyl reductase family protein [Methylibium sp.]